MTYRLRADAAGYPSIYLPMISFQIRLSNSGTSWVSAVIDGMAYYNTLNSMADDGDVDLRFYLDSNQFAYAVIDRSASLGAVSLDWGAISRSTSVEGYQKTPINEAGNVDITGVTHIDVSEGKYSLTSCVFNRYWQPGKTAKYGSISFKIDTVGISVSGQQITTRINSIGIK